MFDTVLDTFSGSDENPITTNWTTPLFSGGQTLKIASNRLATDGFGAAWYDVKQFGPDQEAAFTVITKPADNEVFNIYVRLQNPGILNQVNGFLVRAQALAGTDQFLIRRVDNDAATTIATINQEFNANDQIGIRAIGDHLSLWQNTGTGWTLLGSVTDTAYALGGYLGAAIQGTTCMLDELRGGTAQTPADNAPIGFSGRGAGW